MRRAAPRRAATDARPPHHDARTGREEIEDETDHTLLRCFYSAMHRDSHSRSAAALMAAGNAKSQLVGFSSLISAAGALGEHDAKDDSLAGSATVMHATGPARRGAPMGVTAAGAASAAYAISASASATSALSVSESASSLPSPALMPFTSVTHALPPTHTASLDLERVTDTSPTLRSPLHTLHRNMARKAGAERAVSEFKRVAARGMRRREQERKQDKKGGSRPPQPPVPLARARSLPELDSSAAAPLFRTAGAPPPQQQQRRPGIAGGLVRHHARTLVRHAHCADCRPRLHYRHRRDCSVAPPPPPSPLPSPLPLPPRLLGLS